MTNDADFDRRPATKPPEYQEALILAESGKYDRALTCIREYLAESPDDGEALNDTGTILFSLGCTEEAIDHLTKAIDLLPDSAEIIWNLAEVYLATNQPQQTVQFFDRMEQMGILNVDLLNRTADAFLKNDFLQEALSMLQWSLKIAPQQEILLPMVDIIRSKIAGNTN